MGRHFVVVGGSRGLGRVFAAAAAADGDAASILARTATETVPQTARIYTCDLLQPAAAADVLETVYRERGGFDGLVFFQRFRAAAGSSVDAWEGEITVGLAAVRALIERAAPLFAPDGLRSIVLTSSVNAEFISPQLHAGYHAVKAGLCQLARYYACTLGPMGIRVNAVRPGTFVKPESETYYREHPELVRRLSHASPLGRMGRAAEVIEVVRFLLGPQSSFVTGQSLTVDGGTSLRWHEHFEHE